MDLGLAGKKALVTGSTRGIGRRTAETLLAEGASVAIGARKSDEVESTLKELGDRGHIVGATLNVKDADNYRNWIKSMADALGGIDLFVHNVSAGTSFEGEKSWYRNFELDVMGAVRGIEVSQPYLEQSDAGSVVFISSTGAFETFLGASAYNAFKASLITYGKQLSQELFKKGVRVNVVSPGPTYFDGGAWVALEKQSPDFFKAQVKQHPAKRMGTPEEVARAVVFLLSPAASWINGVNLVVDGGFTKRVQF